jgi:hypothetical protein
MAGLDLNAPPEQEGDAWRGLNIAVEDDGDTAGAARSTDMVPSVGGAHSTATWSGMVSSVVDTQGAARSSGVVSSASNALRRGRTRRCKVQ